MTWVKAAWITRIKRMTWVKSSMNNTNKTNDTNNTGKQHGWDELNFHTQSFTPQFCSGENDVISWRWGGGGAGTFRNWASTHPVRVLLCIRMHMMVCTSQQSVGIQWRFGWHASVFDHCISGGLNGVPPPPPPPPLSLSVSFHHGIPWRWQLQCGKRLLLLDFSDCLRTGDMVSVLVSAFWGGFVGQHAGQQRSDSDPLRITVRPDKGKGRSGGGGGGGGGD